jgi:predicted Zn-dependent protease with MMP-like domain
MVHYGMRSSAESRVRLARKRQFERLVVRALDGLPSRIVAMLDNVDVVVEDEPSPHQLADAESDDGELFGLYEGTPLTERTSGYTMVLPDKITVFRGPLERAFRSNGELARQVRITVVHELAHHVGLDEDTLEEAGWA